MHVTPSEFIGELFLEEPLEGKCETRVYIPLRTLEFPETK